MNHELQDVQAGFRKGRGTRDQIANNHWMIEKAREFQKNIYFYFMTMPKPLTVWITTNCGKFFRDGNTRPPDLPLEYLYADQEDTARTGHRTTNWFQIEKGVCQGCILSPCLFNLYAKYIMRNTGLDEAQARIKVVGETSVTSDMQMTPPLWQKVKRN